MGRRTGHVEMQKSVVAILLLSALGFVGTSSIAQGQVVVPGRNTPDENELIATFNRQFSEGDFFEAAETAKHLVRMLIRSGGNPLLRADALSLLASAQLASGDALAAQQNFEDAIAQMVSLGDRLTPGLVKPLQGLARSQHALGDYQEADRTYRRAVHVHRVNYGLHDLQQASLVGELIDLLVEAGDFDAADGVQTYQLEVLRNNLDETDPRVINAWERRGQILSNRGRHVDAQENYVFAADVMRNVDGPNSLAQVPLLRSLSDSYLDHANADLFTRIEMARVELEKIILILERNPSASSADRGQAHLDMGNFMLRFGDWNAALRHYRKAWEYLDADAESIALRSQYFDGPEVVNLRAGETVNAAAHEQIPLLITIDGRGEVTDVALAEEVISADLAGRAKSIGRKLRYRPTFREGMPLETESIRQVVSVPVFTAAED